MILIFAFFSDVLKYSSKRQRHKMCYKIMRLSKNNKYAVGIAIVAITVSIVFFVQNKEKTIALGVFKSQYTQISEAKNTTKYEISTQDISKAYSKNKHGYNFIEDKDDHTNIDFLDMIGNDVYDKFEKDIDGGTIGLIKQKNSNNPRGLSFYAFKDITKKVISWIEKDYNPN